MQDRRLHPCGPARGCRRLSHFFRLSGSRHKLNFPIFGFVHIGPMIVTSKKTSSIQVCRSFRSENSSAILPFVHASSGMGPRRCVVAEEGVRLHVLGDRRRSPVHRGSERPRFCPGSSDLRHDTIPRGKRRQVVYATCMPCSRPLSYVNCSSLPDHPRAPSGRASLCDSGR
jgi:hypothetical protein